MQSTASPRTSPAKLKKALADAAETDLSTYKIDISIHGLKIKICSAFRDLRVPNGANGYAMYLFKYRCRKSHTPCHVRVKRVMSVSNDGCVTPTLVSSR